MTDRGQAFLQPGEIDDLTDIRRGRAGRSKADLQWAELEGADTPAEAVYTFKALALTTARPVLPWRYSPAEPRPLNTATAILIVLFWIVLYGLITLGGWALTGRRPPWLPPRRRRG